MQSNVPDTVPPISQSVTHLDQKCCLPTSFNSTPHRHMASILTACRLTSQAARGAMSHVCTLLGLRNVLCLQFVISNYDISKSHAACGKQQFSPRQYARLTDYFARLNDHLIVTHN